MFNFLNIFWSGSKSVRFTKKYYFFLFQSLNWLPARSFRICPVWKWSVVSGIAISPSSCSGKTKNSLVDGSGRLSWTSRTSLRESETTSSIETTRFSSFLSVFFYSCRDILFLSRDAMAKVDEVYLQEVLKSQVRSRVGKQGYWN